MRRADKDPDRRGEVMKKLRGVLVKVCNSVATPVRQDQEILETLRPDHFQVKRTFKHGFPSQPTSIAFDPIQKLLAIGSKCGSLRILGKPGVDVHIRHDMDGPPGSAAVLHLQFLVNEGALVSATADDTIHLWNFRQKVPQIVHSLKFVREKITCLNLPLQSKWLYVGSDKGNVHMVQVENLTLSGYTIMWNNAIEVTCQTHPGSIVHLSDNPLDDNKLLIGYERGLIILWDLRRRRVESRWHSSEVRSIAWHYEGKQFKCSHLDGTITTWNIRCDKAIQTAQPHGKLNKDNKPEQCRAIMKVDWKATKTGEELIIFSGGMPQDQASRRPVITVIHNNMTTLLEMEHNVVDFITLCESPYPRDLQEPFGIIVLLQNDLVVIDLQKNGFPNLENPYPMDIHESPVTCCSYLADCPADLVPAFYSVGRTGTAKRQGFSGMDWPIDGGNWSAQGCSYGEIVLTGHSDGSIKFWDASSGTLQVLYKLKTAKVFEKPKPRSMDVEDEPFAIQIIALCPESRKLCVAGASSHVILFNYKKSESVEEVTVLEVPIVYEVPCDDVETSPDCQSSSKTENLDFDNKKEGTTLKVRPGVQKKLPGFQAQLVCLTPWNNGEKPSQITALSVNSSYGLMAYGNEAGIVIIDIEQRVCLLHMGSPDLYGAQDPYCRVPRSPKKQAENALSMNLDRDERQPRSPSIDQMGRSPESPLTSQMYAPSSPIEQACEACEDNSTLPSLTTRRKSSVWSFNLKRQLSKVDNKVSKLKDKRNSIFYEPTSPKLAPDQDEEDEETLVDLTPEDEQLQFSPEGEQEVNTTKKVVFRPDNLDLTLDEEPVRPPRTKQHNQRHLSVPNLKFQKEFCVMVDLRGGKDEVVASPPQSFTGNLMRRFNKLDSSFSRSRSSSMSSLENITSEAIQCLSFADSYTRKSEPTVLTPTLWVGTSLGTVLPIVISPPEADSRSSQPVVVSLVGATIFRLKGAILCISFLDCNGALIPYTFESWKDDLRERRDKTPTRNQNRMSPTLGDFRGDNQFDRQFVIIASEKQARVVALPSQTCVYRQQLTDSDFVVKCEVVSIRDSVCLACYISNGHLATYSLPSLRPLMDVDFLPLSELSFQTQSKKGIIDPMLSIWGQQLIVNEDTDQIARTFNLSNRGHGLYLSSPSELQKFTICSEFCQTLSEMMGDLFMTMEMPEPPKESFFKGLFGGGVHILDRDELFGEASGLKVNKSVAKLIPGAAIQELNSRVNSSTNEISRAHKLMVERGDKLSLLEDKSEKMRSEAENFASTSHEVMLKYKDKKWYQL